MVFLVLGFTSTIKGFKGIALGRGRGKNRGRGRLNSVPNIPMAVRSVYLLCFTDLCVN